MAAGVSICTPPAGSRGSMLVVWGAFVVLLLPVCLTVPDPIFVGPLTVPSDPTVVLAAADVPANPVMLAVGKAPSGAEAEAEGANESKIIEVSACGVLVGADGPIR